MERPKLTQNQFAALCDQYSIDPALALENETIIQALMDRDPEAVERALLEEF